MIAKMMRGCAFAVALALAWAPTGGRIAAAEIPAETSARTRPPAAPSAEEASAYAEREKKASPELARFEGGQVVVITATTVVVVLLVVLLIVLL